MKTAMNFRLNEQAIAELNQLSKLLRLPTTTVIENALHDYAQAKIKESSSLLSFTGVLNDEEGKEILRSIYTGRQTKT